MPDARVSALSIGGVGPAKPQPMLDGNSHPGSQPSRVGLPELQRDWRTFRHPRYPAGPARRDPPLAEVSVRYCGWSQEPEGFPLTRVPPKADP